MNKPGRRFGIRESYDALVRAARASARLARDSVGREFDARFVERLMLAVTEVNGCALCSYAHTRVALRKGLGREEIESLLSASGAFVESGEATAILFAQHYADSRGRPERGAYEALVREYGEARSGTIVAAVQAMMAGNVVGLPLSALLARLSGRPQPGSPLLHEVGLPLLLLALLPFAAVQAFAGWVGGRGNVRFDPPRRRARDGGPGLRPLRGARLPVRGRVTRPPQKILRTRRERRSRSPRP